MAEKFKASEEKTSECGKYQSPHIEKKIEWIHPQYLEEMALAVRATFDQIEERDRLCVYINMSAMKILNSQFPEETMGMTVGSLAFKSMDGTWDFVFDTQHENGIFDMRFHLVILHQVQDTVRLIDFTIPYWRSVAEGANKIDTDTPLIDVERVNPQNQSYVYHTDLTQYGAIFEQDRVQNKVFHEVLLPRLYHDLIKYTKPLYTNYQRLLKVHSKTS